MTPIPSYDLELKAADERRRLHTSVEELRTRLRDKVDVRKNAREHMAMACGVAVLFGLTIGYSLTGIFTHH